MTHASSGIGCRTWGFDYRRRGSARDGPANILWCSARKCVTQSAAHIEISEKSSVRQNPFCAVCGGSAVFC